VFFGEKTNHSPLLTTLADIPNAADGEQSEAISQHEQAFTPWIQVQELMFSCNNENYFGKSKGKSNRAPTPFHECGTKWGRASACH
jgi:hypothetical protein